MASNSYINVWWSIQYWRKLATNTNLQIQSLGGGTMNGNLPLRPEKVGIDGPRLRAAFQLLDEAVESGAIPGAVAVIGRGSDIAGRHAVGYAVKCEQEEQVLQMDTLFDCASLTKVVVTLPLILILLDRGELHLNEPVATFLPEFAVNGKDAVTVGQLLTHTSGLAAHRPFYAHDTTAEQIKAAVCNEPLAYESGTQVVYSDLGFIVLGEIAAKLYGCPLDEAAAHELFHPLGMRDSQFCPPDGLKSRIAATEYREHLGRYQRGDVHDENALALGGVSGHAGLFATAGDLAHYAAMWLANGAWEGQRILSSASVAFATRSHTTHLQDNRGLGWALKGDSFDAAGDLFSTATFGHTGFTGTSVWIDPERSLYAVLLTNRVHFGRETSIARLRACFHNAVAASVIAP